MNEQAVKSSVPYSCQDMIDGSHMDLNYDCDTLFVIRHIIHRDNNVREKVLLYFSHFVLNFKVNCDLISV